MWKKIGTAFLYPHTALMIILIPVSALFLICSMIYLGTESPFAIVSYVLSAYTVFVWCLRIPRLIAWVKGFIAKNKYTRLWQEDARLRVNVSLYGSLLFNTAYAVFQLALGVIHHTFWYYSLAVYYIFLAVMRFFLVRYTSRHKPAEHMEQELRRYRTCGVFLLIMNLALALIIFFMVYWNRTFIHHEITTIALAAYTFTSLAFAIANTLRYRRYNSPVYSASKAISLASAFVSMLTLESTMLTTFGDGSISLSQRRLFLGTSGGAISAFIIAMSIYMIVKGTKKLNQLKLPKE